MIRTVNGTICACLYVLSGVFPLATFAADTDLKIGERIYLQGILPSGAPVRSYTQADIELSGTQVSCVNCHKQSGLGSSEGRVQVPPIIESILFERKEIGRSERAMRRFNTNENNFLMDNRLPKYTVESLRRAIIEGIDPNGRKLDLLMPRYQLSIAEADALIAYMRSLSRELSPGVSDDTLRFATIVAGDVTGADRQTMINVMERYFMDKNADTRNETGRVKKSPWHKEPHYTAYRKWSLDVWQLTGESDTWSQQLNELYEKQAVFAVLGGLTSGDWEPVHRFCNQNRIPCILPSVNYADASNADFYSIYFTKGTALEAGALGKYLSNKGAVPAQTPIVQVYHALEGAASSAKILNARLEKTGGVAPLISIEIGKEEVVSADFWTKLAAQYPGMILCAWLRMADLQHIDKALPSVHSLFLSGSLLADRIDGLPKAHNDKIFIVYPYEIPQKREFTRTRGWAKLKQVSYSDEIILGNTYFMLSMTTGIVKSMQHNLYRDYFVEKVEHMVDRTLTKSVYPHVSLAPGQRFLSKGSYIVKLDPASKDGITPISDWITP